MFDNLSAPFPPEAISWRAQSLTSDGNKAMALAYIDARDAMRRFDAVCGPENWQDRYAETPKGRLIGTIEVRTEQGWVSKSDGAGDTDVEGEKGAISDAFKRTAVKWGVGRYLYDVEVVWAPCETYERNGKKHWKAWKPEAARLFAAALDKAAKATHATPKAVVDHGPPESVELFLSGLRDAYASNSAEAYWTEHWPAVDKDWRPYALEQKEQIKTAQGKVAMLRAG